MYDHATTDRHPVDRPHWYLGYIGVVPVYRSHGVGSALLRHVLEVCDKQALGSYLEASSERSAKLYGRHGFQQTGPAIQLPDGGPKMLPMWREPERTEPKGPLPRENSRRRRAVVAFRLRRRLALAAPASQEEVLQDGTDVLFRCRTTMPPDAYAPG
ncbi:hypothetical protein ABIE67_000497 [Streptomyces sp. V4I8]|uniref:GNAT family N-acetyltransferase n=1 Tax=Streptomyces sp. V4I8 TaxID=3156469 RepID=UPI0035191804